MDFRLTSSSSVNMISLQNLVLLVFVNELQYLLVRDLQDNVCTMFDTGNFWVSWTKSFSDSYFHDFLKTLFRWNFVSTIEQVLSYSV